LGQTTFIGTEPLHWDRPPSLRQSPFIGTDHLHWDRSPSLGQSPFIGTDHLHWDRAPSLGQSPFIGTDHLHWDRAPSLGQSPFIGTETLHWDRAPSLGQSPFFGTDNEQSSTSTDNHDCFTSNVTYCAEVFPLKSTGLDHCPYHNPLQVSVCLVLPSNDWLRCHRLSQARIYQLKHHK